jgi:transmembrane 9 superfamily member 2/4
MENNATCRTLCTTHVPGDDAKFINDRIREDYALNWLIDGLPAAEMKEDLQTNEVFFDIGFSLGNDTEPHHEHPLLHNHYDVVLRCVTGTLAFDPHHPHHSADTTDQTQTTTAWSVFLYGPQGTPKAKLYHCKFIEMSPSLGGPQDGSTDCEAHGVPPLVLSENMDNTVRYTYRVTWEVRVPLWGLPVTC